MTMVLLTMAVGFQGIFFYLATTDPDLIFLKKELC